MKAASSRGNGGLFDLSRSGALKVMGNLGWPILQKEIRADFRKNRFFFTHLFCLGAMAAGILLCVVVQAERSDLKPEDMGRMVFNVFFGIQYLVVLVVFPAFSATALSEERSEQTIDLLFTSDLRPAEIVWGKFLASGIYSLIYIIATVPLLAVSLLFAGVSLADIALAYAVLTGLTMLLCIAGVFLSSCFSSSLRPTLVMYAVSFGVLAYSLFSWWELVSGKASGEATVTNRLWRTISAHQGPVWLPPWIGYLGLFALLFAYLFLFAANRIRPRSQDRTSKLRMITFLAFLAALSWGFSGLPSGGEPTFQNLCLWSSLGLFLVGILFTAEPADVAGRLRRRFALWSGPRYPLRIFAPGPFWGLVYSMVLSAITFGLLWLAADVPLNGEYQYHGALLTAPLYLFTFAALGFYLSSLDFSPTYTALTVSFIFIITLLLPVIFRVGERPDGIFSFYYLSPVTLLNSLHTNRPLNEGPRFEVYGVAIIRIAQVLFGSLAVVFTVLGARASRKKGYPLLSFLPRKEAKPAPAVPPAPVAHSPPAAI